MPDYREILEFLAKNPPQLAAERKLHASLLELLAKCLRTDENGVDRVHHHVHDDAEAHVSEIHRRWVHFS